jgi:nucleoside-diphosphate-sugar epimerase
MRVVVIGGTKFIGPHLVRQLVAGGHDVTVYHRGRTQSSLLPDAVRHVLAPDRPDPFVLQFSDDLFRPEPDVVVHMTAMGERDAAAAVDAFRGRTGRLVAVSSGDVYLAYGRFMGTESGPVIDGLLREDSALRTALYPYRAQAQSPEDWVYSYEKILVERVVLADASLPGVVLRLPKVYGPGENSDLVTVYQFRHHPGWRWTHGYVENVAAAIALAAVHPAACGRVFNVGEEYTPTIAERLERLPASSIPASPVPANFSQNIAYDTTRIRIELGYSEPVSEAEGIQRTLT